MSNEQLYVSLSGIIGAGKTELSKALGDVMGLPVYHEKHVDDQILQDFYADMPSNAFHLQIHLLNQRLEQQQQIKWNGRGGVQDRTIYEDLVFVRMLTKSGTMKATERDTYVKLFRQVKHTMQPPHLVVHLDVPPSVALERVKLRNRPYEKGITIEYLSALAAEYEIFLNEISSEVRVLRVDWNNFADPKRVAEAVKREHEQMRSIQHLKI